MTVAAILTLLVVAVYFVGHVNRHSSITGMKLEMVLLESTYMAFEMRRRSEDFQPELVNRSNTSWKRIEKSIRLRLVESLTAFK